MKARHFLTFAAILVSSLTDTFAQSPSSTFESRVDLLLANSRWSSKPWEDGGKSTIPVSLGRLLRSGGSDEVAKDHIVSIAEIPENDPKFPLVGVVRALNLFRDDFSSEQLNRIGNGIQLNYENWDGGGTPNHSLMGWSNGYLLAQFFGGDHWKPYQNGVEYDAISFMVLLKQKILAEGKMRFQLGGTSEFLSPNYLIHHIGPLLNLWEFAEDQEVKNAAEALLLLHFSHLALNVQGGFIMPPFSRMIGPQYTSGPTGKQNGTVFMNWLYWGLGNPSSERLQYYENYYSIFAASSEFRLPNSINRIATGDVDLPFVTQSNSPLLPSIGFFRNIRRYVYRGDGYSIGSGVHEFRPDGFYKQNSDFAVAWRSNDNINFLEAGQPYWLSDEAETDWWLGPSSPFMQVGAHENSAIVLFKIPTEDPWPESGHEEWRTSRDGHIHALVQLGMFRFPKAIDEIVQFQQDGRGFYFLREGQTYIALQTLRPSTLSTLDEDFNLIKMEYPECGAIIEVTNATEAGSFESFQEKIKSNTVSVDWDDLSVEYVNLEGRRLRTQFNDNRELDAQGLITRFPIFSVDGITRDYDEWPDIGSPYANLDAGRLSVTVGDEAFQVDWSGSLPVISGLTESSDNMSAETPLIVMGCEKQGTATIEWDWETYGSYTIRIERSTDPFSGFDIIADLPAENLAFEDSGLEQGKTYFYRVSLVEGKSISVVKWSHVQVLTEMDNWRIHYFGSSEQTGQSSDDADPDGDGWTNLSEYATLNDPTVAQSSIAITTLGEDKRLSIQFNRRNSNDIDFLVYADSVPATGSASLLLAEHRSAGASWKIIREGTQVNESPLPEGAQVKITDGTSVPDTTPWYIWLDVRRP